MSLSHIQAPPEALLGAVRTVLAERLKDKRAHTLSAAVRRVSLAYRREQGSPADLVGDKEAIDARLAFFLPRDFPKLELPLRELDALAALPPPSEGRPFRILDLGAGLGTTGLCAALFVLSRAHARAVTIDAVESDAEALRVAQRLATELSRTHGFPVELRAHPKTLARALSEPSTEGYDLVLLGFMLNELGSTPAELAETLRALCSRLSPGGSLIVLEPALRDTSRTLQETRDLLVASGTAPHVFAPCLHARACPMLERERDWCHERVPLALPKEQAELAREAGLREEDLTFSYLTLRNEPRSLAQIDRAEDLRLYRIVGGPLITKGKRELLVCGSDDVRVLRRLDRHASGHNAAFDEARRGSILGVPTERASPTEPKREAQPEKACSIRAATTVKALHGP